MFNVFDASHNNLYHLSIDSYNINPILNDNHFEFLTNNSLHKLSLNILHDNIYIVHDSYLFINIISRAIKTTIYTFFGILIHDHDIVICDLSNLNQKHFIIILNNYYVNNYSILQLFIDHFINTWSQQIDNKITNYIIKHDTNNLWLLTGNYIITDHKPEDTLISYIKDNYINLEPDMTLSIKTLGTYSSIIDYKDIIRPMNERYNYLTNEINVNYIDDEQIKSINIDNTLLIKSATGSGKTKALLRYINKNYLEKILIISSRQSYTDETIGKWLNRDLIDYRKVNGDIILSNVKTAIVQLESINRIKTNFHNKPDLLILDESESIMEQFLNPIIKRTGNTKKNYEVFKWLLEYSEKVVVMDAYMGERSLEIMKKTRGPQNINLIINEYKKQKDVEYNITEELLMKDKIIKDIVNGKKVVVCSNSKEYLKEIEILAKIAKNNLKYKLYNGDSTEKEREDLMNVNKSWFGLDLLMYTSTITAGCSFEKKWYEIGYAYFTDKSCNYIQSAQMVGRVRNIKEWYLSFSRGIKELDLPEELEELEEYINNRWDQLDTTRKKYLDDMMDRVQTDLDIDGNRIIIHKDLYYYIHMFNLIEIIKGLNKYKERVLSLLTMYGGKIMIYKEEKDNERWVTPELSKQIKKEIKDEDAKAVSESPTITLEEKDNLQNKIILTKEEKDKLQKNKIIRINEINPDNITPEHVLKYGTRNKLEKKSRKKEIESGDSIGGTLEAIKEEIAKQQIYATYDKTRDGNLTSIGQLNIREVYNRHLVAVETLQVLGGAESVYEEKYIEKLKSITKKELIRNMQWIPELIKRNYNDLRYIYHKRKNQLEGAEKWTFRHSLQFINGLLRSTYDITLKDIDNKGNYKFVYHGYKETN
jgi:hypothetical protein